VKEKCHFLKKPTKSTHAKKVESGATPEEYKNLARDTKTSAGNANRKQQTSQSLLSRISLKPTSN
jgi:hypothetical protein